LSYYDTQNQVTLAGKTAGSRLRNHAGVEVLQIFPQTLLGGRKINSEEDHSLLEKALSDSGGEKPRIFDRSE
jgi:hypothetical protein